MQTVLSSLNSVPGVIGSLACDAEGRVLAQSFPPSFETARLAEASRVIADGTVGFGLTGDSPELLDFRYGDSRLLVKPFPGALLLALCQMATNPRFLLLSISVTAAKLAKLREAAAETPPGTGARPSEPGQAGEPGQNGRRVAPPTQGLLELRKRLGQLGPSKKP